jgi:hypothetical protein
MAASSDCNPLRSLLDAARVAQIHPGLQFQKAGRRHLAPPQQHRDHRKSALPALPNQRRLHLVLLRVADAMRTDQDRHRPRIADRFLQVRQPLQARAQIPPVVEGANLLRPQPRIDLLRPRRVGVRIAEEDIKGPHQRHCLPEVGRNF